MTLLPSGVVGTWYDQAAEDLQSSGGNSRLGAYDGSPTNLYGETGSFANATGYGWHTIPEFVLTSTTVWLAWIHDSTSARTYYNSSGGSRYKKAQAFGAMPSTASAPDSSDTVRWHTKLGHS